MQILINNVNNSIIFLRNKIYNLEFMFNDTFVSIRILHPRNHPWSLITLPIICFK